jgi:tetratricopeptide (TPR) repeat protein
MSKLLFFITFILFAFVATWFLTERMKAPEDALQNLYEANIKPPMNYWTTDPNFTDTISLQAQAMSLYDKGEYTLALEAFQRYEPTEKDEALYNLYLGLCYLKSDFGNLAVTHFIEAGDLFKKFEMIQMSKWYLALAYLKVGQEKEAVDNLKKIVEVNASQRYKAEEILKQIDVASNPIKSLLLVIAD